MVHLRRVLGLGLTVGTFALGCSDDPAPNGTQDSGTLTDRNAVTDVNTATDANVLTDGGSATDATDANVLTDGGSATDATDANVLTDGGSTADGGTGCTLTRALITTTDYRAGGYALGPISPPSLMALGTMSPDQDHAPVESGCIVFNLLRGNDTVAVLDPAHLPTALRTISLRSMLTVDAGASPYQVNPYDVIALSPSHAYVAQLALSRVAIIDPSRSGAAALTGSIDLSPLRAAADTDPSGSPEAIQFVRANGRVLVLLQNLSSFAPVADGVFGVIDPATDTLVDTDTTTQGTQGISLGVRNPAAAAVSPSGARIAVAGSGVVAFAPPQSLDGALVSVDTSTLQLTSGRITEAQLGGDLAGVALRTDTQGWAIVNTLGADGGPTTSRVVAFDLATATVGATVYTSTAIGAIARSPDGNLWVLDRGSSTAGVRVFRPDGTELTTVALSTGSLAPSGVAFVP